MSEADWLRLVALLMVSVLVLPAALRLNRHTWLRNVTIWLAVVVALVFAYEVFGPF